jgi:thiol:disulfide interchange protein
MRYIVTILFAFLLGNVTTAQIKNPVKWKSELRHIENDLFELTFTANIQKNWNVYSMYLENEDGPIATTINFDQEKSFKLQGKAREEGKKKEGFDPIFEMNVVKFSDKYTIIQRLEIKDYNKAVSGYLNFMTCDDEECLPPTDVEFSFSPVKGASGAIESTSDDPGANSALADNSAQSGLPGFMGNGMKQPVRWSGQIKKKTGTQYELTIKADIEKGWNIYSQDIQSEEGPVPTMIVFDDPNGNIKSTVEFIEQGSSIKQEFDEFFQMELKKIKESATFTATIELKDPGKDIKGFVEFMACDDTQCMPPIPIEFEINAADGTVVFANQDESLLNAGTQGEGTPVFMDFTYDMAKSSCDMDAPLEEEKTGWFWIFILGFLGGLIAILTPCVFPMIPLTISYFTKSSTSRAKGISNALTYGISIIVIYLLLGLLITGIFGADALNLLSTNAWFNIAFGILFIVFAISFFGYFEITLPSNWVNKADEASNKGGLIGIFFMAFTLSLVSFSCTGPIIGTLLVETATGNSETIMGYIPIDPLIGMFGFSLALALPFGLFAAFPSWLNSLPRSGNWMNTIKVTLGFVEVALALKFFSIADLTMGWKILPYELFVALWVLCAVGLGLYYFGILRFPHDHGPKSVSNLQKIFGSLMMLLAIYFATGFTYSEKSGTFHTPNLLSGLAPPAGHSYIYPKKCPLNLNCYKDYYEGVAVAIAQNKPVMIDFTGHGCVNCRRMEDQVWGQAGIYEMLRDKYVVISLYVDERKALDEPYTSVFDGKLKRTIGNKWADFQQIHFNRNSQPYYVLAHPDGTILNTPVAYTPNVEEYRSFLACGLKRFEELNQK